jgi:hypothetical protein
MSRELGWRRTQSNNGIFLTFGLLEHLDWLIHYLLIKQDSASIVGNFSLFLS